MNTSIFLPKKIKVGYVNRSGTFDGKLAYVIYYDEKGKLRKETSFENWRDKKIECNEFDNVPISGITLNKKVGGYSSGWNHRNTYARIYDSRGFEFEITMENLLYILEHTNSIKGKALDGEFVYGWYGGDHILIPTSSPDYQELVKFNENRFNPKSFKGKDMKIGGTYLSKDNKELIYIGRYMAYNEYKNDKREYFFYDVKRNSFTTISSLTKNIIECLSEECVQNYAEIFEKFEYYEAYNPYDSTKDEYYNHTLESFNDYVLSKKTYRSEYYKCENIEFYMNNSRDNEFYNCNYPYSREYYINEKVFKWTDYREEVDNSGWYKKTKQNTDRT